MNERFQVEQIDGTVADFHGYEPEPGPRRVLLPKLTDHKTLVLGSAQRESSVDRAACEAAGVSVTRRRSGGGAVLVSAEDVIWFDIVIGVDDPLWHPDVTRSFDWLGECLRRALLTLGVPTKVHTGALIRNAWSDLICFAGLGPGEATIDDGGLSRAKVVGISQRRTRDYSRFQVAILRRWSPTDYLDLLEPSAMPDETALSGDSALPRATAAPGTTAEASSDVPDVLERAASGIGADPHDVLDVVLAELPAS